MLAQVKMEGVPTGRPVVYDRSNDAFVEGKKIWETRNCIGCHTLLGEGDRFRVGNIEITTLHTPGHTPESMSYAVYAEDSGEKCWIVPFDAFEGLRSAVAALATAAEGSEG